MFGFQIQEDDTTVYIFNEVSSVLFFGTRAIFGQTSMLAKVKYKTKTKRKDLKHKRIKVRNK